jgi:stage III sporulation protein AB
VNALAVRLFGSALLAAALTGAGLEAGMRARRRVAEVRALVLAVSIMRSEVSFAVTPLPAALARAGAAAGGEVERLLRRWANGLARGERGPEEAWQQALEATSRQLCLREEDLVPMDELVQSLGRSDRDDQTLHLERAAARLSALADRLEPEAERTARLLRSLGLLGGLAAAILVL